MDDRDLDYTMMNIQRYSGGTMSLVMLSTSMSVKLLTFLLRMAKKGLTSIKFADAYRDFMRKTEGDFTVYNIPLPQEHAEKLQENLEKVHELEAELEAAKNPLKKGSLRKEIARIEKDMPEIEQLKRLNIDHCVLPKLNGSDNTLQVAVSNKDAPLFKNWFLNHLSANLSGGSKTMGELEALTESNYSIFNIPFEGDSLADMFQDFDTLAINYSLLPDLKIGDGYSQVAVANADRDKIQSWFKMYQDKKMATGEDIPEMYEMSRESYLQTSALDVEDYIANTDQKYQAADLEYAAQSKDIQQKAVIRGENAEDFQKLSRDSNFEKVTINKATLVDKANKRIVSNLDAQGFFVSRIPKTYGENEKDLLVPKTRTFVLDDGKTYAVFLPKSEPSYVADAKSGRIEQWKFNEIKASYDRVDRNLRNVQKLKEQEYSPKTVPVENSQTSNKREKAKTNDQRFAPQKPSQSESSKSVPDPEQVLKAASQAPKQRAHSSGNKFHNFEQRTYDYSSLEQILLAKNKKAAQAQTSDAVKTTETPDNTINSKGDAMQKAPQHEKRSQNVYDEYIAQIDHLSKPEFEEIIDLDVSVLPDNSKVTGKTAAYKEVASKPQVNPAADTRKEPVPTPPPVAKIPKI